MLADLNANHHFLGYRHTNTAGRQLYNLTLNRTIQHIGPHFPTYYSANSNTTPDIILTNFRTHHNTHTAPGPLTTSDHIPIIFTISASPIQIPSMPRPSFKQANWASFKTEISENINSTEFPDPATLEDIDTEVEKWHETIKTATKNNIPTTRHRTLPTPKHSHETNTIMIQFTALRTHAHIHGWTRQQYNRYRNLRGRLQEALIQESNTQWTETIAQTAAQYKNANTFWRKIKALSGQYNPYTYYLLDDRNERIYKHQDQEKLHREIWDNVFQEDEDEAENEDTTNLVKEFLTENIDRTTPYHTSNKDRLNDIDDLLTDEINEEEIKYHIRRMKKTCPEIHYTTKTKPINIRLHERAVKIWTALEDQENPIYEELKTQADNITTYNNWFPSSLTNIDTAPTPNYH
ncbi:hypothetical protein Pmani_003868 [Petrolisthes manimaculis]|uniref:Endonuclease/exonuclease/phosphatase domain-containing protein n=1 Tax=Petrolisthes manimaculis TaxID=1843537 RepID=A0AAE1UNV1_9EUCA|nr:hypothetical protein Pmani_003868 [Petrolisthes manimaculis]